MAIRYKFGIEIPTLLSFFAVMLSSPVNTNFVIYRTCYVILGFNETDCAKLGTSKDNATDALEKLVEPHANVIVMTTGLLGQLLPAISCLFIGSWSDKHGRRPILITSMAGYMLTLIIQTIICMFPNMSPWALLLQSIPSTLTGSLTTFIMIALCYVTDTSSVTNRGLRIGIFELMFALGTLLGTASSSYIFNATSYTAVFAICSVITAIALLYVYFFAEESIPMTEQSRRYTNPLSYTGVKELVTTVAKKRHNYKRAMLFLLMTCLIVFVLAQNNSNVLYPFFRVKFHWSMRKFTMFSSLNTIVSILGTFFGIYVCNKLLKISELTLLLVAFTALSAGNMLYAFATTEFVIYIGALITCVTNVVSPMVRSLISKIIEPSDSGKVFAFLLSMEAIAYICGNLIMTMIYNATLTTFPSAFYLFAAIVYTLLIVVVMTVCILRSIHKEEYTTLIDEEPELI